MKKLRSSRFTNEGERDEHLLVFCRTEPLEKKERRWRSQGKSINTPLLSNGHLSAAVPPLVPQCLVRHCLSPRAALLHPPR
jgi:hypothetical protein